MTKINSAYKADVSSKCYQGISGSCHDKTLNLTKELFDSCHLEPVVCDGDSKICIA